MALLCCSHTSTHPSLRASRVKGFKLICGEHAVTWTELQLVGFIRWTTTFCCRVCRWLGIRAHHLAEFRDKHQLSAEGAEPWAEAEHLQQLSGADHRKVRAMLHSDAIQVRAMLHYAICSRSQLQLTLDSGLTPTYNVHFRACRSSPLSCRPCSQVTSHLLGGVRTVC